jgi:hypothetical protein
MDPSGAMLKRFIVLDLNKNRCHTMTRKISAPVTNEQDNIDATLVIGAHDHCTRYNKFPERPDIDQITSF